MLLLIAYFFNTDTYNSFNQAYYTSSLLILFGSLGFNFAITQVSISQRLIFISVLFNIIITYMVLYLISDAFHNPLYIISVIIYSYFGVLGGIFTFQILFTGHYLRYVYLTLLYSILHLAIIPVVTQLNINVIFTLPFITIAWFGISYPGFIKVSGNSKKIWKQFYKIGLSAFIINSAVSFALSIDKYFVNSLFDSQLANSYTFAWSLTAPVFYIGGIIEKFLYSGSFKNQTGFFKKGLGLSFFFITIYAVLLITLISFFPQFLPASVDKSIVGKILVLMITGYSVYSLFHFPVNAFLFKFTPASVQKTISLYFTIVILILSIFFSLVFRGVITLNYTELLLAIWIYIFLLLTVKVIILFKGRNKISGLEQE